MRKIKPYLKINAHKQILVETQKANMNLKKEHSMAPLSQTVGIGFMIFNTVMESNFNRQIAGTFKLNGSEMKSSNTFGVLE